MRRANTTVTANLQVIAAKGDLGAAMANVLVRKALGGDMVAIRLVLQLLGELPIGTTRVEINNGQQQTTRIYVTPGRDERARDVVKKCWSYFTESEDGKRAIAELRDVARERAGLKPVYVARHERGEDDLLGHSDYTAMKKAKRVGNG